MGCNATVPKKHNFYNWFSGMCGMIDRSSRSSVNRWKFFDCANEESQKYSCHRIPIELPLKGRVKTNNNIRFFDTFFDHSLSN